MPTSINYIDRLSQKQCKENIYGLKALQFLYTNHVIGSLVLHYLIRYPFFSKFYGWLQTRRWTKRKILPFIQAYQIDASEFALDSAIFDSFNSFFIRRLKAEARPISSSDVIIPADGRYLFFPNIEIAQEIMVKGIKMDLNRLVGNPSLAQEYLGGTLVIARLCPSDYHRYHFPLDGKIIKSHLINGWLYSVNPMALRTHTAILTENKRILNEIQMPYGKMLLFEVGATCVGSIHHTFTEGNQVQKGAEMGYFSFGGSCLLLLFQKNTITLDADLLALSASGLEIRCLMGQSLGIYPSELKNWNLGSAKDCP